MNYKLPALLTIIAMHCCLCQIFAQSPDFSGRWRLNMDKSKLEHQAEGLTGSLFIITQDGNKFRLTRYHLFGNRKNRISFKMVADGRMRRVNILFKAKLERKENGYLATLWRKNFLNVVNYKFGTNQNEFVADEVFKSKVNNHHNIWVFDREISK